MFTSDGASLDLPWLRSSLSDGDDFDDQRQLAAAAAEHLRRRKRLGQSEPARNSSYRGSQGQPAHPFNPEQPPSHVPGVLLHCHAGEAGFSWLRSPQHILHS